MQFCNVITKPRVKLPLHGDPVPHFRRESRYGTSRQLPSLTVHRRCISVPDPSISTPLASTNNTSQEQSQKLLTFQEAISRLQQYWSSVGCTIYLPHNTEVGAGTMNPATFLRVLGPEPWNVCYVEPSIRPDDSRFGDNPNRIQRHTQFQVILKPDPGNPQELYLKSLEALGINCDDHDVRFVEDNWESPVLGAWGLGWEVWLDGMEITQFTYFQQTGSLVLPVPAIEITYGLERILMSLQNVNHFKDIQYNNKLTYGELFLQTEVEMSQYNMEEAPIEDQWTRFSLYRKEAEIMLKQRLPIPAYDNLLKCSHCFNVLDARGAVGVTERNTCFSAMRKLARLTASLWLEKREEMKFPLNPPPLSSLRTHQDSPTPLLSSVNPELLVMEIGCEELPPDEVELAARQLQDLMMQLLNTERLSFQKLEVYSTTRRLSVLVYELAGVQTGLDQKIKGPPVNIAYDEKGQPTKALLGFCKKSGIPLDSIVHELGPKGVKFVYGLQHQEPLNTAKILLEKIPEMLKKIGFQKSMKWTEKSEKWSRPIRWILAFHGTVLIPLQFAGVTAGSHTSVLRHSSGEPLHLSSANQYSGLIKAAGITLDASLRRQMIWKSAQELAETVGGVIPEKFSNSLLPEVVNLVEAPNGVLGTFSTEFLTLPKPVLETVMTKYQRYFPVYSSTNANTTMLPYFIAIGNGHFNLETVTNGFETVLKARFKDAQFFYKEDLKSPLESFLPQLAGTTFHKSLGSLLEKTQRTTQLIKPMGKLMEITEESMEVAERASKLARADLATSLVTEMTSLAGIMGEHYSLKSGESSLVSRAIYESILPRFSGDDLPETEAGVLVSIADKMDSLVGLVSVGCAPTATADPFSLRRIAYGLVQALISNKKNFSIKSAIGLAAKMQPVQVDRKVQNEVFEFIERRLEQLLMNKDIPPGVVRGVLSERSSNPYLADKSTSEVLIEIELGEESKFPVVREAFERISRMIKDKSISGDPQEELLVESAEQQLYTAYKTTHSKVHEKMKISEFLQVCDEDLVCEIGVFFEEVFVMAEDLKLRENRLRLLKSISSLSSGILNFTELTGF
eukprot:g1151.t1